MYEMACYWNFCFLFSERSGWCITYTAAVCTTGILKSYAGTLGSTQLSVLIKEIIQSIKPINQNAISAQLFLCFLFHSFVILNLQLNFKIRRTRSEGGEESCLYMCVGDSPSTCPRSEGNPPTMAAHTSPGLHLEGLQRQRGTEKSIVKSRHFSGQLWL